MGRPMPPCAGLAAIETQPPSAMARYPWTKPGEVRTTPFSSRAGCRSPVRCRGASTSSHMRPASDRMAAAMSGVASAKRSVAAIGPRPIT